MSASTSEVSANTSGLAAETSDVAAETFDVSAETFDVSAETFDRFAETFHRLADRFEGPDADRATVAKPFPPSPPLARHPQQHRSAGSWATMRTGAEGPPGDRTA